MSLSSLCAVGELTHIDHVGGPCRQTGHLGTRDRDRYDVCNECAAGKARGINLHYVLRIEGSEDERKKLADKLVHDAQRRRSTNEVKSIWNRAIPELHLGHHRFLVTRAPPKPYAEKFLVTHVVTEERMEDEWVGVPFHGFGGARFVRELGVDGHGFICAYRKRFVFIDHVRCLAPDPRPGQDSSQPGIDEVLHVNKKARSGPSASCDAA